MSAIETAVLESLRAHLHHFPAKNIWLAYSGGMDSHVLLVVMSALRFQLPISLQVIHIHHGLQPLAETWAIHCQTICAELQLRCEVVKVQVNTQIGESIEAQARLARYAALQARMNANDILLTAQHQDDQAETLLLQLFRGSGVAGLAAMPEIHRFGEGWLLRPFLRLSRQQLHEYAVEKNLQWIEDDSNQNRRFDRNFLRHDIIPQLQQRWTQLNAVLSRVARHQAEAQDLLIELGQHDLTTCFSKRFSNTISILELKKLSPARQRNLLRTWLKQCNVLMPSTQHLHEILAMSDAAADRQPVVCWADVEIRRYQNCLFLVHKLPSLDNFSSIFWNLAEPLPLPLGQLRAEKVLGRGIKILDSTQVKVQLRHGGEMGRWRGHRREIKKLLQQWLVPPWLRHYLPLIYVQDTLVALPNLMICDDFQVAQDEIGWLISWEGTDKFGGIAMSDGLMA